MARVLARFLALLLESLPGECRGARRVRGCYAIVAMIPKLLETSLAQGNVPSGDRIGAGCFYTAGSVTRQRIPLKHTCHFEIKKKRIVWSQELAGQAHAKVLAFDLVFKGILPHLMLAPPSTLFSLTVVRRIMKRISS